MDAALRASIQEALAGAAEDTTEAGAHAEHALVEKLLRLAQRAKKDSSSRYYTALLKREARAALSRSCRGDGDGAENTTVAEAAIEEIETLLATLEAEWRRDDDLGYGRFRGSESRKLACPDGSTISYKIEWYGNESETCAENASFCIQGPAVCTWRGDTAADGTSAPSSDLWVLRRGMPETATAEARAELSAILGHAGIRHITADALLEIYSDEMSHCHRDVFYGLF